MHFLLSGQNSPLSGHKFFMFLKFGAFCPRTFENQNSIISPNINIITYFFLNVKNKYQYIIGIYVQNVNVSLVVFLFKML